MANLTDRAAKLMEPMNLTFMIHDDLSIFVLNNFINDSPRMLVKNVRHEHVCFMFGTSTKQPAPAVFAWPGPKICHHHCKPGEVR